RREHPHPAFSLSRHGRRGGRPPVRTWGKLEGWVPACAGTAKVVGGRLEVVTAPSLSRSLPRRRPGSIPNGLPCARKGLLAALSRGRRGVPLAAEPVSASSGPRQ